MPLSPPLTPSPPQPQPSPSPKPLPSPQRSQSPYPHASSHGPDSNLNLKETHTRTHARTRNEPHCTCQTPSCPLHNGLWDLVKRAGLTLYVERVEREEERLNPTGDPEISETLELEDLDLRMPTVEEVLERVVGAGWNLRSECWRWG